MLHWHSFHIWTLCFAVYSLTKSQPNCFEWPNALPNSLALMKLIATSDTQTPSQLSLRGTGHQNHLWLPWVLHYWQKSFVGNLWIMVALLCVRICSHIGNQPWRKQSIKRSAVNMTTHTRKHVARAKPHGVSQQWSVFIRVAAHSTHVEREEWTGPLRA